VGYGAVGVAACTWGASLTGVTAVALVILALTDVTMDFILFHRASPALRLAFLFRALAVLGAVTMLAPKIVSVLGQR
jgi:hypothetical protein